VNIKEQRAGNRKQAIGYRLWAIGKNKNKSRRWVMGKRACFGEVYEMDFYTAVLRKNGGFWVALCLENGLVGQGSGKETAIQKLKEAIQSFQDVCEDEIDVYSAPVFIKELHEFLTVEAEEAAPQIYELRAVNA
jgi:predicted RNase H-like HicB family nuclease